MERNIVFQNVRVALEDANVCQRCILRYFGEKEYTSYITKSDVEKRIRYFTMNETEPLNVNNNDEASVSTPLTKRFLPNPCALCLGILQDACDEMISKVDETVLESKNKFTDFVLHISLPVVLDLRERLFNVYLKEKVGEAYSSYVSAVPSVKDICKWVIGSQYGKMTNTAFKLDSNFQIYLSSIYPSTVEECLVLLQKCPGAFPNAQKRKVALEDVLNKTSLLKAMEALSSEIEKLYDIPPSSPKEMCKFNEIKCTHSPLYLGGRYNKYSRELSQTPWVVDGERKMESSVSELITDVVQQRILSDKIVFSSSGREDVDVRMLGNGRPFILEIINPRCIEWSKEEMKSIQSEINSSTELIAVRDLQVITKLDTSILKEGEENKRKVYSALCLVEKVLLESDVEKLENLKDLKLGQKTPLRVLHRRSLSCRERVIHSFSAKIMSDHLLQMRIETQAGTYVKEFVHGDFGRTTPNLGTLLNTNADILELDVEDVKLDWPPKLS